MPENFNSIGLSGFRPCVVYSDHLTYADRDKHGALLAAAGWRIVAWEQDHRALLGEQPAERPALVRAIGKAAVHGVPVILIDRHDARGEIDLVKIAAAARTVGVEVRLLTGPVLESPLYRDEMEHAARALLAETLALRDAVNGALTVHVDDANSALGRWTAPQAPTEQPGPTEATEVVPATTSTVVDMSRYFRDWYDRTAVQMAKWDGPAVPPLPDPDADWYLRRRQVGTLAAGLQACGWHYGRICGLLREIGVTSNTGIHFYPGLLAYYRRTASDYKAA